MDADLIASAHRLLLDELAAALGKDALTWGDAVNARQRADCSSMVRVWDLGRNRT